MKVMHVGEYVSGGVATYLKTVILHQEKCEKIENVILLMSDKNSEHLESSLGDTEIIRYSYNRTIFNMINKILYFRKILKNKRPDIVHIHSSFAGVMMRLAIMTMPKFNGSVIYCAHGWSFFMGTSKLKKFIYLLVEKLLSIKTDRIINISEYEHRKSIELGFPVKKTKMINNGVSSRINIQEADFKLNDSNINLLFVGRFDRQKGLDILFKVFKEYRNPKVQLYVIGAQVLNDQTLEIPNNVHLLGWINNEILDSYYTLFDAVIIPSRWEGFGLVGIEAMKNKKAIIVSDRGALPNLISNNNGFIFNLSNTSSLKNILENLEKEDLKVKGLRGYELFMNNYTSERMNQEIIKLYISLFRWIG